MIRCFPFPSVCRTPKNRMSGPSAPVGFGLELILSDYAGPPLTNHAQFRSSTEFNTLRGRC
jgi:hypothetical protein